jgi:hypothetical protein
MLRLLNEAFLIIGRICVIVYTEYLAFVSIYDTEKDIQTHWIKEEFARASPVAYACNSIYSARRHMPAFLLCKRIVVQTSPD